MAGIFISYRRDDSADICGRIYDHLVARYGKPAVFKDVDDIPYGADFPAYIQAKLAECSVCLAVIGPKWLEAATPDGRRRLDDPGDFVRLEIETALRLGLVVVPVLVYGARVAPAEALPATLEKLPHLNAAPVRLDPDFATDVKRLAEVTDRFVPPLVAMPTAPAGRVRQPLSPKARRRLRIALIAVAVVAVLAAGGVVRYFGPIGAIQGYLQAYYTNDVNAAYAYYCPEQQAAYPESKQQAVMAGIAAHAGNFNLSGLRYTLVREDLTSADVRLGGSFTYNYISSGNPGTWTSQDNSTDIFNLQANGLGWCLSGVNGQQASPTQ
jgi:hypothetical protein